MRCTKCGKSQRLYKHYQTGEIRCSFCVPGHEFEAGMWEEVK